MIPLSPLQKHRANYTPAIPHTLAHLTELMPMKQSIQRQPIDSFSSELFPANMDLPFYTFVPDKAQPTSPLKVGVVLSGGQAPGGHTVIAGLFDALKQFHPNSKLIGFCNGPSGIIKNQAKEIDEELLSFYRNQGGFDLIGSGRTKIETFEQFEAAGQTLQTWDLDGLVIIGGDDSNTNAAFLAEHCRTIGIKTKVVGVPKTIDGDLKNQFIEISFGFDTASKVYSEIIGNLLRDAQSSQKYYFFIKIMGRSASHQALECALRTHPNLTLISEEVDMLNQSLDEVVESITNIIVQRAKNGKNYGGIVIPEGLIEFIPDCKKMLKELSACYLSEKLAEIPAIEEKINILRLKLSQESLDCFETFPQEVKEQLLLDPDPHGNIQVSKIETERLLISLVERKLNELTSKGTYKGTFSPQPFFCGYEGRSALPSNFDCQYSYALGQTAALLIRWNLNGYMACVSKLTEPVQEWKISAAPLCQMLHIEMRKGKRKAVIKKSLVDMRGKLFAAFMQNRSHWALEDDYISPGPIQFEGPHELTDAPPLTLTLS